MRVRFPPRWSTNIDQSKLQTGIFGIHNTQGCKQNNVSGLKNETNARIAYQTS